MRRKKNDHIAHISPSIVRELHSRGIVKTSSDGRSIGLTDYVESVLLKSMRRSK
jgi:hypothetical protein